ncbi:hypothetical protein BGS_0403 [Beggiatoa sp. SS]|nr:hypothetical protein BGS_0403 [Beggiatoa sp. SS]
MGNFILSLFFSVCHNKLSVSIVETRCLPVSDSSRFYPSKIEEKRGMSSPTPPFTSPSSASHFKNSTLD